MKRELTRAQVWERLERCMRNATPGYLWADVVAACHELQAHDDVQRKLRWSWFGLGLYALLWVVLGLALGWWLWLRN